MFACPHPNAGTEKGGQSTVTDLRVTDLKQPNYDILQPCPSDLHCLAGLPGSRYSSTSSSHQQQIQTEGSFVMFKHNVQHSLDLRCCSGS